MAMGCEGEVQGDLMMTWAEMPRAPGHVFYDRLQKLLVDAGFDAFVEEMCKPFYAPRMGAPSLPPGRYFRMHMVGFSKGSTASAALSGAARILDRWEISCGLGSVTRFQIIRGCRRRAAVCLTKFTRKCSPSF